VETPVEHTTVTEAEVDALAMPTAFLAGADEEIE
jgi:hypothetical protein